MNCPKCGDETTVHNTRMRGTIRWRRRKCADPSCAYRFTTEERLSEYIRPKTVAEPKHKPRAAAKRRSEDTRLPRLLAEARMTRDMRFMQVPLEVWREILVNK